MSEYPDIEPPPPYPTAENPSFFPDAVQGEVYDAHLAMAVFHNLGLCMQCTGEHLATVRGQRAESAKSNGGQQVPYNPTVEDLLETGEVCWAVTLVPNWQPNMIGPGQMVWGLCCVPTCTKHIAIGQAPPKTSSLLVPGLGGIN